MLQGFFSGGLFSLDLSIPAHVVADNEFPAVNRVALLGEPYGDDDVATDNGFLYNR